MLLTHNLHLPFTHSLFTTPFRPLHLTTPILNLKSPSTPPRFTSFTVHADSSSRQSQPSIPNHVVVNSIFDSFLSLLEFLCLLSSLIVSVSVAVIALWKKELYETIGNRVAPLSMLLLVVGVLTGALIRRRRDIMISGVPVSKMSLLPRIQKLEGDLARSADVIRVLSRQLEKLGMRFQLTRKNLKEPISETASLAQKNSKAATVLAMQSDVLEKEVEEIQKVLLAMQQKQLDLILAIVKPGNPWESKQINEVNQEVHQI
ncbi:hypothetical protein KIW84_071498 [Lathyrus oleraceus]|uniref:Transmembrane protein n=1 Tax=Pisum sativum TaxID=3888 RepID=A0A9D4ZT81_PEA|nr:hypothetical protein KIW84_071498 [Pisum sativum]